MKEIWKPVIGYEGYYEVSSIGNVRRIKVEKCTWNGRILKNNMWGQYHCVTLCREGKEKRFHMHTLVARHFIGPKPVDKDEVNHKDGNKLNNADWNLEYVTVLEQSQHAIRTGLTKTKGEDNGTSKLTEDQVRKIRICGGTIRDVGAQFGVTPRIISLIRRGLLWRHVQ
jgi:hypothetical protein